MNRVQSACGDGQVCAKCVCMEAKVCVFKCPLSTGHESGHCEAMGTRGAWWWWLCTVNAPLWQGAVVVSEATNEDMAHDDKAEREV